MSEQMTEDEKLELFKQMLSDMDNEKLAKLLLNKSLQKLALLLEEDMATAADFNVIRAILKDNNIGIVPTRENAMGKLQEKLKERSMEADKGNNIIPVDELTQVDIGDFIMRH